MTSLHTATGGGWPVRLFSTGGDRRDFRPWMSDGLTHRGEEDPVVNTPTLFIMCGLPYSGKTTFSKRFAFEEGCVLISIDDVRESLGFVWGVNDATSEDWRQIYQRVDEQIATALSVGRCVVYDSANQDEASRRKYRSLAESLGCRSQIIFVDTPVDVIQRRRSENRDAPSRPNIPRDFFESAVQTFVPPNDADIHIRGDEAR